MLTERVIVGHQPQYFPYIGIFNKILKSDIFLFVDSTKFVSKVWHNRTIIKDKKDKVFYLTIPVSFKNGQIIKDVKIIKNNWKIKHLKSISNIYGSSKYFGDLFPLIEEVINQKSDYLIDYTINSMEIILSKISYDKSNIYFQSKENIVGSKNDLIVNIVKHFKSNKYLTGEVAKDYVKENYLKDKNIDHSFNKFKHPIYTQNGNKFIENLSIIDCIFNIGFNDLKKIIKYINKFF